MNLNWIVFAVSVGSALVLSFICSLLEAALLSLTPSQLADIRRKHPTIGDVCSALKQRVDRSIAVILIANTAAHTIGASVGGAKFEQLCGSSYLWIFSISLTLIMVQYTEILPKTLGVRFNKQIIKLAAHPLQYLIYLLMPLIKITHFLNLPFEFKGQNTKSSTAEEISALAALARSSQLISSRQERIIRSVPELSKKTAREVMLPCENISMLPSSISVSEAIDRAAGDFHTRYPVCEAGDRDRVIGYINFKELVATNCLRKDGGKHSINDLIRPIGFADPDDTAAKLLENVLTRHSHLVIIRDPDNGKTLGMVTQEDVIEEMLGDLDDEFDPLPRTLYSPSENLWIVGGGIPVSLLARETHMVLPNRREPLAVWFARELGRLPRVGDTLQKGDAEFFVRKLRRGRVFEFTVRSAR